MEHHINPQNVCKLEQIDGEHQQLLQEYGNILLEGYGRENRYPFRFTRGIMVGSIDAGQGDVLTVVPGIPYTFSHKKDVPLVLERLAEIYVSTAQQLLDQQMQKSYNLSSQYIA